MDLVDSRLSKISQAQKYRSCRIPFIWGTKRGRDRETESRRVGFSGAGWQRLWGWTTGVAAQQRDCFTLLNPTPRKLLRWCVLYLIQLKKGDKISQRIVQVHSHEEVQRHLGTARSCLPEQPLHHTAKSLVTVETATCVVNTVVFYSLRLWFYIIIFLLVFF